jgi:hypothetical protein
MRWQSVHILVYTQLYAYCNVFQWLRRGFGLVKCFIGSSLVITKISSYILKITVTTAHVTSHTKSNSSGHTAVPLELRNSSQFRERESESHCDWRSVSDIYYCLTVTVFFMWDALSDERTGRSFVYAAGSCQRSLSRVQVPWYSRPYFTVSDLRLPFSSPPTTRRVTVEVFDPASTRVSLVKVRFTLRLTCRAQSGAYDQIFITVSQVRSCFSGVPSLTRGRVVLLVMAGPRYITSARTAQKTPLQTALILLLACPLRSSCDGYWATD